MSKTFLERHLSLVRYELPLHTMNNGLAIVSFSVFKYKLRHPISAFKGILFIAEGKSKNPQPLVIFTGMETENSMTYCSGIQRANEES